MSSTIAKLSPVDGVLPLGLRLFSARSRAVGVWAAPSRGLGTRDSARTGVAFAACAPVELPEVDGPESWLTVKVVVSDPAAPCARRSLIVA